MGEAGQKCRSCDADVAPEVARITEQGTLCPVCYARYEADSQAAVQQKSRLGRTLLGGAGVIALVGFSVAYYFWSGVGLGEKCHEASDCRSGLCLANGNGFLSVGICTRL